MNKIEKILELQRLFSKNKRSLSIEHLCLQLECSEATFHRIRKFMVARLGAPLIYDAKYRGYRYDLSSGDRFELPGLWLSSRETEVLLSFHEALSSLQHDFFSDIFTPVKKNLSRFLKSQNLHASRDESPVRIIPLHSRPVDNTLFGICANAVIMKKTLSIIHDKPDSTAPISRTISPFCVIRYRDNWYLDAYCHLRSNLRTFSLDRIHNATPSGEPFHAVSKKARESFYSDAYGIFNGPAQNTAHLRFTGPAAEIVSREQWHPRQKGERSPDGHYHLTIPYSDDRELVMDVLKWGESAEVLSPPELRNKVKSLLITTLSKYNK